MSNGQPSQQSQQSQNSGFDALYLFSNIHASSIANLIRCDFGREALGWNSFLAMFLMLVICGATDDKAMLVYLGVWLVAQAVQRIRTYWLLRHGAIIHSRYAGYPYLAMKVPFVRSHATATGFIEPMMCLVGGTLLCTVSVNLGGFIMVGFLSFMVRNGIEKEIQRKRIERMRDAEIEQRWYSNAYKYGLEE